MKFHTGWLAWLGALLAGAASAQAPTFPRPAELEPDIAFWTRVYTEIDTKSGFIHDSRNLGVIYRVVRFDEGESLRSRNRELRSVYEELREILGRLASGKRDGLSEAERRVLEAWPPDVTNVELRAATERLRFQLGQSDRFRSGLIRAGTWKPYIEAVLERRGLPRELVALPHVESSFDPTAYSKVGAAGMWQFTRSTGLRYMRIDHIVDERRDPYFSTVAAARLLESNYGVLQSWPLALTAYNHGVSGMRRAVQQQRTDAIEVILRNYDGRTFGFASRNFYVAFLAAVDVDANAEKYFGALTPNPSANMLTVELPDFVGIEALEAALGIDRRELRHWNPALLESVWSGDKFVPKGFELRLPATSGADPAVRLAAIPAAARYTAQMPDIFHRVGRGETISEIAARYGVSMTSLVELNGLRSRNFIRAGQVLRLPGNGATAPVTLAQLDGDPDVSTYVVRAGDSVGRIAQMFSVDETVLLANNGISDRNRIYVGQKVRVRGPVVVEPEPSAAIVAAVEEEPIRAEDVVQAEAVTASSVTVADAADMRSRLEEQRLLAAEAALATVMESGVDAGFEAPAAESGADDLDALLPEENVLASEQADLAADPSDYLVAADDSIEVQALETLGHYADWLNIRTQRLRDINQMPFGQAVVIGRRLKLDLTNVDAATFEQRRQAYQQHTQEAFFLAYQITDTLEHVVRPGESLWVLAQRRYRVPVWLVRQFNPDLNLDQVHPGTVVKFPALRLVADADTPTQASN